MTFWFNSLIDDQSSLKKCLKSTVDGIFCYKRKVIKSSSDCVLLEDESSCHPQIFIHVLKFDGNILMDGISFKCCISYQCIILISYVKTGYNISNMAQIHQNTTLKKEAKTSSLLIKQFDTQHEKVYRSKY